MGSVTSPKAVPVPQDITAAWCSKFLLKKVKSATIVKQYHGTASKLIVSLTYGDGIAGPRSICVKGGFNADLMAQMPVVKFVIRREAEFYYYLVDLRLPRPYLCPTDIVNGQGIVVMEDMSADTELGSPLKVRIHDKSRLTGSDDLAANPYKSMVLALLSPAAFTDRFVEGSRPPIPAKLNDRERVIATFRTLWYDTSAGHSKFRCLIHGDPHAPSTFVRAGGLSGFLGWQGLCFGHPFHDLAYFLVGALIIADRCAHQRRALI
ncbi:hypothetical protein PG985_006488 [Apiospora marii]|uniref:Aminoglycoside phosphotransferase domain-containing protein n=1 Tax=Apiospora marii TaxID=335849 RepID=A0ABR1S7R4_9PEZI